MRRLSSLGSKQLKHRKGRSALTASGIVLGVAILFGVLVSNATTSTGVDRLVTDFTGAADVLAGAPGSFDATLDARIVERIERLPDVRAVAGSYNFRSRLPAPGGEGEPVEVSVRGIERRSAERQQPYPILDGRWFTPGAREVMVPRRLAEPQGLRVGEPVSIATRRGIVGMTVVAVLANDGAGRTNQGDVLFTSIETTRRLANKGDVISGARIVLEPGIDPDAWIDEHRDALGPGVDLRNAQTLAEGFQSFLDQLGLVFTFFATITLFVGAFLIYLTLSMAVIERIRVYGTLRALGGTRAQVRRVVLTEAFALGTLSTAIGLLVGLAIAKGLLAMVSSLFDIDLPGLTVEPGAVIAAVGIGIATTVLSSLIPARRASRLPPVVAMKGDYASETRLSRMWIVGAIAAAAGAGLAFAGGTTGPTGGVSTPLILLGAVLLVPLLLRPLARVLGRLTNKLAPGVGNVAVLHLVKERSRSAYTLALIMIVMAMIFSIGGLFVSMGAALDDTIDRQFGADIQIESSVALGEEFARELRAMDGVEAITALRFGDTAVKQKEGDEEAFLVVIEPETYFRVAGVSWVDGTDRDARADLSRGNAVLMTEIVANQLGKQRGDIVRLRTARGFHPFEIVGTFASFAGPPVIVTGFGDGQRYFNAQDATEYHLDVARGFDTEAVRDRIEAGLGSRYRFVTTTAIAAKEEARAEFRQYFNIIYAILAVAAVVGVLGLANTLAMSVLQRYREIGILRAVGTTRGQIWRMVLVESTTLGSVALVLALPLGSLLAWLTVRSISDAFGFDVEFVYPAAWVPLILLFGAVAAVIAAIAPGRRAARLEPVSALQYE